MGASGTIEIDDMIGGQEIDNEALWVVLETIGVLPATKQTVHKLVGALLEGRTPDPQTVRALGASSEVFTAVKGFLDGPLEKRTGLWEKVQIKTGTVQQFRTIDRRADSAQLVSEADFSRFSQAADRVADILSNFLLRSFIQYREALARTSETWAPFDSSIPTYPFANLPTKVQEMIARQRPDLLPRPSTQRAHGKSWAKPWLSRRLAHSATSTTIHRPAQEDMNALDVKGRERHTRVSHIDATTGDVDILSGIVSFLAKHGPHAEDVASTKSIIERVLGTSKRELFDPASLSKHERRVLKRVMDDIDLREPLLLQAIDAFLIDLPDENKLSQTEYEKVAHIVSTFCERAVSGFLVAFAWAFRSSGDSKSGEWLLYSELPNRAKVAICRAAPSLLLSEQAKEKTVLERLYPYDWTGYPTSTNIENLAYALFQNIEEDLIRHTERVDAQLRPSQRRTLPKVAKFIKEPNQSRHGLVRKTTGAGKTIEFGHIASIMRSPVIIRVPRTKLLTQTPQKLVEIVGVDPERIVFIDSGKGDCLEELSKLHLMTAQGVSPIVIMTDQTFLSIYRRKKSALDQFMAIVRLAIEDESHRSLGRRSVSTFGTKTPSKQYVEEENDETEAVETDEILASYPSLITLHYTATPNTDTNGVEDAYNAALIDHANLEDALSEKSVILPRLPVLWEATVRMAGSTMPINGEDFISEMAESGRVQIGGMPIDDYMIERYLLLKKRFGYLPFVFYAGTIAHAQSIKEKLEARWVHVVRCTTANKTHDEGMSTEQVERLLERGEVDVVVTVMKIAEGWDNSRIRGAAWCKPPTADWMHVQGNGRAFRPDHLPIPGALQKNRDNSFILQPSGLRVYGAQGETIARAGGYLAILKACGEIVDPELYEALVRESVETGKWLENGCIEDMPPAAQHQLLGDTATAVTHVQTLARDHAVSDKTDEMLIAELSSLICHKDFNIEKVGARLQELRGKGIDPMHSEALSGLISQVDRCERAAYERLDFQRGGALNTLCWALKEMLQ